MRGLKIAHMNVSGFTVCPTHILTLNSHALPGLSSQLSCFKLHVCIAGKIPKLHYAVTIGNCM